MFVGNWIAQLIGPDAFSKIGHTRCAIYLKASLQTDRVLQGYIELEFIAHPEVSSVVVEHLIQTRVPMAMQNAVKAEVKYLTTKVKTATALVEKLDSKLGQQATNIVKLRH
jgi:hypothetical protein